MKYKIIWKPRPLKFLNKLTKETALRILNKIDIMKENPFRYLEHYEGAGVFKFRIGDCRALISADIENKILTVEVLDKRGRIYKR